MWTLSPLRPIYTCEQFEEIIFIRNQPRIMGKEQNHFEPSIIACQSPMKEISGSALEYALARRRQNLARLERLTKFSARKRIRAFKSDVMGQTSSRWRGAEFWRILAILHLQIPVTLFRLKAEVAMFRDIGFGSQRVYAHVRRRSSVRTDQVVLASNWL
ncbi:hypothetical protein AVEN_181890-1 [Araneus ventricosus]|uniref:Uncharacterized protein n=1 Tax=Araneus ventricosus TaxID=182803 RepID=A0A4Y2Q7I5_ARAVE|nr:hypothetical protein AVEN_181890-1 [Araneus ventricosus]